MLVKSQSSEDLHVHQRDISQHLHLCDPAQVLDPVLVVQLVNPINSNFEVLRVAEDDDLQRNTASCRKVRIKEELKAVADCATS